MSPARRKYSGGLPEPPLSEKPLRYKRVGCVPEREGCQGRNGEAAIETPALVVA